MLTQFEVKLLNLICRISGKSLTIPFYYLENGRLFLKPIQNNLTTCLTWLLLVTSLGSKTYGIIQNQDQDINNLILSSIFWLPSVTVIILQLNLWLYPDELIRLTNQILYINWFWGQSFSYHHVNSSLITIILSHYNFIASHFIAAL